MLAIDFLFGVVVFGVVVVVVVVIAFCVCCWPINLVFPYISIRRIKVDVNNFAFSNGISELIPHDLE